MALILRIENETTLPDGGPVSITVSGRRNIDIGRDSHLDWTLPDPTRHISSKHCEIRYNEGGYWLHDVSTNGTFLNGSDHRMQAPHRLRTGDRFAIGHYIIGARVEGEEAAASPGAAAAPAGAPNYQELWAADANVAPPIDRALLKPKKELQAANRDFLDWAADIPDTSPAPSSFGQPGRPPPRRPEHGLGEWTAHAAAASPRAAARDTDTAPARLGRGRTRTAHGAAIPSQRPRRRQTDPRCPPTPPRAAPPPAARQQPGAATSSNAIAQRLAQGARVPEDFFAGRDPAELAELFGQVMRLVVENTMQLLNARVQAKRLARSSSHTMIEALNNNPLKFSPSAEDAMRIMFGPATRSYLDAYRAFAQSFDDLKSHQIKTYSAMQHALITLMEDLDPQTIEREAEDRGIASLVTSRKAKLWDAYVARWQAKTRRESGGMIDSFMLNFAEYYDREGE